MRPRAPSLFDDRYSLDAIDSVAAMPVIRPDSAMRRVFCMASVRPASVPVISTMASFMPSTMLPTYDRRSSSSIASSACSCDSSSARMLQRLGRFFRQLLVGDLGLLLAPLHQLDGEREAEHARDQRESQHLAALAGFISSPV